MSGQAKGDAGCGAHAQAGQEQQRLCGQLQQTLVEIYSLSGNSADLLVHRVQIGQAACAFVMCEGMFSTANLERLALAPLLAFGRAADPGGPALLEWVRTRAVLAGEQREILTYQELFDSILAGFVVLLIDGCPQATALGLQGFERRSVSEPDTEVNLRGSREGFTESLRVNMSLIRRRLKSPSCRMQLLKIGQHSRTDVCLCYRSDLVDPEILRRVHSRLEGAGLDVLLEAGYLQPYLERGNASVFSGVGYSERPDTVCAKISEGRVAILVDNTPFCLIIPFLFHENFQTVDDYTHRPYYAALIRWLKYLSFLVAVLLPGAYVAVVSFHPELLPSALLYNIARAGRLVPFPPVVEALLIHLVYEIVREAGLRLPRAVGHAASIIGGLVIGDAAVTANLVSAPMVMVVALTAICSFVVPSLYEPVTLLRLGFILAGGGWGLFGVMAVGMAVFLNLCAVDTMGIPLTSPVSPFSGDALRDVLTRAGWPKLARRSLRVQDLPGSDLLRRKGGKGNA